MRKKTFILGIESSCDETSVAIVTRDANNRPMVMANIVKNQIDVHKEFGGVVPELAARAHSDIIDLLVIKALKKAKIKLNDIAAVAATTGPGLLGGLLVGVIAAKTLSSVLKIPFISINHLEGHALSAQLEQDINFPYLLLLVSGGHTEFTIVKSFNKYNRIGTTVDDALGEAFDKTARLLKLGYPGGPQIEKLAQSGNEHAYDLPKPLINEKNSYFSFSGLKTSVAQLVHKQKKLTPKIKKDIAASFQKTIGDIIKTKTKNAINEFIKITNPKNICIVVAGGVAANQYLKNVICELETSHRIKVYFPSLQFCTDNGAMIAYAGLLRYEKKMYSKLSIKPRPRWPLDENASFVKGKGIR
ncbi:MAG: tRNA (adenosine(37)-N6)-threonylcarbamoyltransferase complex transferase subunit TsaD [Rhodobacteraceae bacterium]|nr:tRNA (adenosine(37)-N6)-threonylcarbamoyltransferase complex transferase subunit TsaD [Paracoccaceae bacterium]